MKCPRCDGNGSVPYHIADDLFDETNCPLCGGSGEVMTNEEQLKKCNTEQLAWWIVKIVDCDFCPVKKPCKKEPCKKQIEKWLKQTYTEKERYENCQRNENNLL